MSADHIGRRIDHNFDAIDSNGNGFIEWDDLVSYGDRVKQRFVADADQKENLDRQLRRYWEWLVAQVDSDADGRVSRDEYRAVFLNLAQDDDAVEKWSQSIQPLADAIVDVVDEDGDGKLNEDEFVDYLRLGQTGDADLAQMFREVDRNGNGFVSREEFAALIRDFYLDPDTNSVVVGFDAEAPKD